MTSVFPSSQVRLSPEHGQLTVHGDGDLPHIGRGDVVQGAALVLARLVTLDVGDLQVFILTHEDLAFWEGGSRENRRETGKPGTERVSVQNWSERG